MTLEDLIRQRYGQSGYSSRIVQILRQPKTQKSINELNSILQAMGNSQQATNPSPEGSTSENSTGPLSKVLGLANKGRQAYNYYNKLFGSGTETGSGSAPVVAESIPSSPVISESLQSGASPYLEGSEMGLESGVGAGTSAATLGAGELGGGLPSAAGDALMSAGGGTAAEGAVESGLSGAGLGTAGMLAAPAIMMWLANMRGSGKNEPLERTNQTIYGVQDFTNLLKNPGYDRRSLMSNLTGWGLPSQGVNNEFVMAPETTSDLAELYLGMQSIGREGVPGVGSTISKDQNSGFTNEQIDNMLMKATGLSLDQLYDIVKKKKMVSSPQDQLGVLNGVIPAINNFG